MHRIERSDRKSHCDGEVLNRKNYGTATIPGCAPFDCRLNLIAEFPVCADLLSRSQHFQEQSRRLRQEGVDSPGHAPPEIGPAQCPRVR